LAILSQAHNSKIIIYSSFIINNPLPLALCGKASDPRGMGNTQTTNGSSKKKPGFICPV
jgi:hypothetical protein